MNERLMDQFDLVLIINLANRNDRRREVLAQLASIGHDTDSRIEFFPAIQPTERGDFRSIGARGCFLSHLGCIEQAVASGAKSLLILEDDVDFAPDYPQLQQAVASRLRAGDWEMFYGGGNVGAEDGLDHAARRIVDGTTEIPHTVSIGLAHFVAIRGERIVELRDYLHAILRRPFGDPAGGPMDVDGAYVWFRRERDVMTLIASPQLAYQRSSASNITPRWFDEVPGMAGAAGLLRRLKRRLGR